MLSNRNQTQKMYSLNASIWHPKPDKTVFKETEQEFEHKGEWVTRAQGTFWVDGNALYPDGKVAYMRLSEQSSMCYLKKTQSNELHT